MTATLVPQHGFDFDTALYPPASVAPVTPSADAPSMKLRPYQEGALSASAAREDSGVMRQGISLPTGTGKTVVFAELIRRRGGKAVIIAHRDELIKQAASKVRMVAPGVHVGIVKAEKDQVWAKVAVCSVQTLINPRRLKRLMMQGPFTTVVVDEAHHAAAASYQKVLAELVTEQTLLFGVSATWDRADRAELGGVFDEIVFEYDLLQAIQDGYLSDIRAKQIKLAVSFQGLKISKGDFKEKETEKLLEEANAPAFAVRAYKEHAEGRKALLFAPTVASAMSFAESFRAWGYTTGTVWGEQSPDDRDRTLKAFHEGRIQILTNCAVLTEGYDEPAVDCVIIARPTRSRSLYAQMVGRGTRLFPGKDHVLVIDLVGATKRLDLVTAAALLGVEEDKLDRKSLLEIKDDERKQEAKRAANGPATPRGADEGYPAELPMDEDGRLVSENVELFKRRELHWATVGSTVTLAVGDGVLSLREHDDGWTVELVKSKGERTTLMSGLDIGYAQGYAEDYARKNGVAALVNPEAAWRKKPMSEKQMHKLRSLGVPPFGITTAGEASDRIDAAIAAGRGKRR